MHRSAYAVLLAGALASRSLFAQPEPVPPDAPPPPEGAGGAAPTEPTTGGQSPTAPTEPTTPTEPKALPEPTPTAPPKPEPKTPASAPAKQGEEPAAKTKEAGKGEATAEPEEGAKVKPFLLPGHWVARHVYPEELSPPLDPDNSWATTFAVHGYVRAPLRLISKERENPAEDESSVDIRQPWLVDDDYFRSGFSYTPVNETDMAEVYFMVGNQLVTANVALMASLFSDSARVMLDQQLGISQAWVTFRHEFELDPVTLRLKAKGGSFWDRFGAMPKYDTYVFGRTHQMGGQLDAELDYWRFTWGVTAGFGAHREAIEANQGLSPLAYVRVHGAYDRIVELGLVYLSTWTNDKRQLSEILDGKMDVYGADVRIDSVYAGKAYFAIGSLAADKASFLSPSIELMHSNGGRGITENYLGTESSNDGTGDMWNLGAQYDFSVADTMNAVDPTLSFPLDGDVTLSAFMLYSFVNSDQESDDPTVNRDNRGYFKQGLELAYWILPWIGVSGRYDRVVPDLEDDPSSFRIISPRLSLRSQLFGGEGVLFYQFAHYDYSERVGLRAGQIPNETMPDNDVHKIQAQLNF